MNIIIVGLNHKTAPVEIRERFTFPAEMVGDALRKLVTRYGVNEAAIISTCNRVEIIGVSPEIEKGVWGIKRFLAEHHRVPLEELEDSLYVHTLEDAVRHLFRVASSLDSMVMGEAQILGQIKDAYGYSVDNSTAGVIMNKLFHRAFSVAKRIRTETEIGSSAVSISFAAVELAKKIFGDLHGRSAMLLGAGEMAELAAKHLISAGASDILIANRTYERAVNMARAFRGTAIMFREFHHYLKSVDIVIASTGAGRFIIKPEDIEEAMSQRRHMPMFFIDIAVPRNIDPLVNNLDNAYVYDIDDLQGVVEANLHERAREAKIAGTIIEEEIPKFYRWVKSLDVVPTIIALKKSLEEVRKSELEKSLAQMGEVSARDREVLEAMTKAIVNKFLHNPVTLLKREANKVEGDLYVQAARKLFNLAGVERELEEEIKEAFGGDE